MAVPEVDKSLTKALREIPEKGKSENGRINTGGLMVGLGGLEPPTSPLSVLRSLVSECHSRDTGCGAYLKHNT